MIHVSVPQLAHRTNMVSGRSLRQATIMSDTVHISSHMKGFSKGEGGSICPSHTGLPDSWREQYGGGKLPKHDQTVWFAVIFILLATLSREICLRMSQM